MDETHGKTDFQSQFVNFQAINAYKKIITYVKPNQTVHDALMSWAEKGITAIGNDLIKLAKSLRTSINVKIYEETYETLKIKITNHEENVMEPPSTKRSGWQFIWDSSPNYIHGILETHEMAFLAHHSYFEQGAMLRKYGQEGWTVHTNSLNRMEQLSYIWNCDSE